MREFRPALPYNVATILLKPTHEVVKGVPVKRYPTIGEALDDKKNVINVSYKTYGGTERDVNGIYAIEDTANIETCYRPDIKSDCRIARLSDNAIFEIINEPENINMMNRFIKFKVRRVKGGA